MMFQFVALGFKARNAGKYEHPITRLDLSALPLQSPPLQRSVPTVRVLRNDHQLCPSGSIRNRINVNSSFSHYSKACISY